MRHTTLFAACAIAATALLASCGQKKSSIEVKLLPSEAKNVYLGYCNAEGDKLTRDDTVAIKDGVAVIDVTRFADKSPIAYFLYTEKGDQVYFVPQDGSITIEEKESEAGNPDAGSTFEIKGKELSNDNVKLQDLYSLTRKYNAEGNSLNEQYQAAAAANDSVQADKIRNDYGDMVERMQKEAKAFIAENASNIAGQVALANNFDLYKFNIPEFDAIVKGFPEGDFKTAILTKMEPARKIQVGQDFIDVALPTPEGDTLRLSEVVANNKVTLLDFWASWCGPCRQFNPILVEIYSQFHGKGFEIYGVSLDQERDKWLDAIKNQHLTWNHVSNLKSWDCPARVDYMVEGIPSSVLIGSDGKIIAHSLDGDELKAKLTELLAE